MLPARRQGEEEEEEEKGGGGGGGTLRRLPPPRPRGRLPALARALLPGSGAGSGGVEAASTGSLRPRFPCAGSFSPGGNDEVAPVTRKYLPERWEAAPEGRPGLGEAGMSR